MKATFKLPNLRGLVVEADGIHVALTLTVGAVPVGKQMIDLGTLGGILAALEGAGAEAQAYKDALDRQHAALVAAAGSRERHDAACAHNIQTMRDIFGAAS
jgi:hypothetical protein